tara:strand:+ start:97 stop:519 length:423 start_codon:yes stop_codon:yes gene_type:complete
MKFCYKCKEDLEFSSFHKAKGRSDGYNSKCKDCQRTYNKERYEKDPESFKYKRITARYGLSKEEYLEMAKDGCHSCGSFKILHVDHDHGCCPYPEGRRDVNTCGQCIRGILCKDCNTAEGLLHSDIETAEKLLRYMKRFA